MTQHNDPPLTLRQGDLRLKFITLVLQWLHHAEFTMLTDRYSTLVSSLGYAVQNYKRNRKSKITFMLKIHKKFNKVAYLT